MASIVDLIKPEIAFDPETISVLSTALEEAWERLLKSGSECTRPAYARAMRVLPKWPELGQKRALETVRDRLSWLLP